MSDERITISRRKTLAALGTTGAALGLGGLGTYAQFTDTEEETFTFTAGGVDGEIEVAASYNNQEIKSMGNGFTPEDFEHVSNGESEGVDATLHFEDVKPGDYGSILFGITVENNPSWVTNCLGIKSDTDGQRFEPEAQIEGDGFDPSSESPQDADYVQQSESDVSPAHGNWASGHSPPPNPTVGQAQNGVDVYGLDGEGELAENFLILPFYDSDNQSNFFDGGVHGYGAPSFAFSPDFFDNMNSASLQDLNNQYRPLSVRGLQNNTLAQGTVQWAMDNPEPSGIDHFPAPENHDVGEGCVILDGELTAGSNSNDNSRDTNPIQPGSTVYYGYDWHIPFGTGNEAQGDELELGIGFIFSQLRHSGGPVAQNLYVPEGGS